MDDRPEATASEAAVARYKSILQHVIDNAPVRHAPAARRRARQEPQLRLADHQSGLRDADPGAASRDDLRDLPFLARRAARTSSTPMPRPIPRRSPVAVDEPRGCAPTRIYLPDLGDEERNHELDRAGRRFRPAADPADRRQLRRPCEGGSHEEADQRAGHGARREPRRLRRRPCRHRRPSATERKFVRRGKLTPGKVALISGGGSGHEPLHAGFVGIGMLDAACPGQVFTSPTPDQMIAAAEAVDGGAGVLFIVKNYEGDVMNFDMAAEMAGREIMKVVTDDDVAVETSTYSTGRRGVAGTLVVEKIVGAAAEAGARSRRPARRSATGSTPARARWAWR